MVATARPEPKLDRRYRILALIGVLGVFIAALFLADASTRPEVIGCEGGIVTAALVLTVWNRLPVRPRPTSKFTRDQLMVATFMSISLTGATVVPDVIEHKTSTWSWVVLPILLACLFVGFLVVERRADDRTDGDLVSWRRTRPPARPKSR